ncbi:MAG: sigma-54 dependent transcriptional regulator [Polyangiaceae bacterium]
MSSAARTSPLLLVEDDPGLAQLFARIASKRGYSTKIAPDFQSGRAALEAQAVGVLVTDVRLPDGDGIELVRLAREAHPELPIIAVTAFGSIELAVRAMRAGAYDFLTKPVDPEVFGAALDRADEARRLRDEVTRLRSELAANQVRMGLIGRSPAIADIVAVVERVADSPATVLVHGPTGTGKERVARMLHETSKRRERPFVAVNAAAVPENLLESELFGYTKGAFTDARIDKKGLVLEAEGGTLFLDEIGDLPMVLQAKLLRVLQEREVRPLGALRAIPVDVRIVAATHRDLKKEVAAGRFREDLYYRLAVIEITIPPLKDRPEDIMPLAEFFLQRAAARAHRAIEGFSAPAARRLVAHSWPGNVRELENAVERAVAFAQGAFIVPDDLPPSLDTQRTPDLFASAAERMLTLEEVERGYVRHVLDRLGGNKVRAAAALGISRRTIQRWLGETDSDPDE